MKTLQNRCLPAILVMMALACVWPQAIRAAESEKPQKQQKQKKQKTGKKRQKLTTSNTWSFEEYKAGTAPKGWKVAETKGKEKTATWKIIPGGCESKQAIAITENKNTGKTYNLLIARRTNYKDLEISVMVKAMTGEEDQGGGPIWRAKDANNYYIARWNPLEDNLRVYYVKGGKRIQLASADIKTDVSKWHEVGIEHVGNKIIAEFDGEEVIEIEDSTFAEAGMVGLWTKADSATAFDDFEVEVDDDADAEEDGIEWLFEKNEVGSVPKGWNVAETKGKGKTATWKVISGGYESDKAVAITKNKNSGKTYNLLIAGETNYKDLGIGVMVKAMTGKQDQGGGPIWRAKDADNYYIARWNPLEDNLRVYYVKGGKRVQLASADIKTDVSKWHEVYVEHVGNKIMVEFDGEEVIVVEDSTFTEAGMVGLWTKADSATAFDDVEVGDADDDGDGDKDAEHADHDDDDNDDNDNDDDDNGHK